MSDKSWEPGMYECLNVLNNFCFHVYAQNLLSHFLTLTLSHSFTLLFTHSRHAEQLLFSCLCSKVTLTLLHSLSLSLVLSEVVVIHCLKY